MFTLLPTPAPALLPTALTCIPSTTRGNGKQRTTGRVVTRESGLRWERLHFMVVGVYRVFFLLLPCCCLAACLLASRLPFVLLLFPLSCCVSTSPFYIELDLVACLPLSHHLLSITQRLCGRLRCHRECLGKSVCFSSPGEKPSTQRTSFFFIVHSAREHSLAPSGLHVRLRAGKVGDVTRT